MVLTVDEVNAVYRAVLRRDATEAEQVRDVSQDTKRSLADSLFSEDVPTALSAEVGRIALPMIRMYQAAFGRVPDNGGMDFWVGQIRSGAHTIASAAEFFIGAPEAVARSIDGSVANLTYVTALYSNVLGREPDEGGLNFWLGEVNSGARSRAQILGDFVASPEFANDTTPFARTMLLGLVDETIDADVLASARISIRSITSTVQSDFYTPPTLTLTGPESIAADTAVTYTLTLSATANIDLTYTLNFDTAVFPNASAEVTIPSGMLTATFEVTPSSTTATTVRVTDAAGEQVTQLETPAMQTAPPPIFIPPPPPPPAVVTVTGTDGADDLTSRDTLGQGEVINALGGNDTIAGGGGADTIDGGEGDDVFVYLTQDDLASGSALVDASVVGGAGSDTLLLGTADTAFSIANTAAFTAASELESLTVVANTAAYSLTLNADAATAGIQTIDLSGDSNATGNNTVDISAYAMSATLIGSAGADMLTGGTVADSINGGAGADTLNGGAGSDTFVFGSEAELFTNDALVDSIVGGDAADTGTDTLLLGTAGTAFTIANTVSFAGASELESLTVVANTAAYSLTLNADAATAGVVTIDLSGDDNATGDNTVDVSAYGVATTLTGSAGADSITGGTGADSIAGAGGDDTLSGGAGADNIAGGEGNDRLAGGTGADTLNGGAGSDTFVFGSEAELFANDALVDTIVGGTGTTDTDTLLLGTAGTAFTIANTLSFAGASELESLTVVANTAAYSLTLNADAATAGVVTIDLSGDDNATGDNTVDVSAYGVATTLTGSAGADSITGGTGADSIAGAGGDDTLSGGAGADNIAGGEGNDRLAGGTGADTLNGGAGDNVFVFGAANELFTGTALVDTIIGGTDTDTLLLGTTGTAFTIANTVSFGNASELESLTVVANSEAYNLALNADAATAGIVTIDLSGDSNATGNNTVDVSAYGVATTLTGSAGADVHYWWHGRRQYYCWCWRR